MSNYAIKDKCRKSLLEYTARAFSSVPMHNVKKILDAGCGTGVVSILAAKLSRADITAVDTDKEALDFFKKKIRDNNLKPLFTLLHSSLLNAEFKPKSFDLVIAEGIFHITGFEKSVLFSRNIIRKKGFLIIHDDFEKRSQKEAFLLKNNFRLINQIELNSKIWGKYIQCLKNEIVHTAENDNFHREKAEIEMYFQNPYEFQSIISVWQLIG